MKEVLIVPHFADYVKENKSIMSPYILEDFINDADSIAWDTCHKIYILMSPAQTEKMREYGYEAIITMAESNPYDILETIKNWYDDSCGLRFIDAVADGDVFTTVVAQGEDMYAYV